ncbi:hypothetical protein B0H14DRAFT_2590638 [Mycena olivaceomarginata]|nr:hypothetical protein B0H14DRAFT_2653163 [Mycena olivaceomarginata]KAJ7834894.1 hypothetical protein B0H14DRAFT_2590638 [Mycena olivaceomarginata]
MQACGRMKSRSPCSGGASPTPYITPKSTHTPAATAAGTLPVPRTAPLLSVLASSPSAFDPEFATPDGAGASTVTVTSVVAGGGAETEAAGVEEAEAEAIVVGCTVEKKVLVEVLRISEVLEVTGGAESALVVAGGSGVLVVSGVVAGGVLVVAGVVAGGVLVVLGGGGAAVVLYSIQEAVRVSARGMEGKGKEEKGSMDVHMDGVHGTWTMDMDTDGEWREYTRGSSISGATEDVAADAASRARPSRLKGAGTARTREAAVITTERKQAHDPSLRR